MELYERLPLAKINHLNKITFDEFKRHCSTSCKNEAERKIKYEMLKKFCQAHIKAKAQIRRIYAYTLKTPNEVGGRLYCGNSVQGLSKQFRGFLCGGIMTDIDMKNAHPTIARYLCKLNKIEYPNLNYYIQNRDQVCERFGENGKTLFLKALNDDKLNKKIKDDFFRNFDAECKSIQKAIIALPKYKHIVDTTPLDKAYNWNGSAFNRIMCVYENKILDEVVTVLNAHQIELGALMFDGCMVYGDQYGNENLLREIEARVNSVFEGLNMIFAYKEHDTSIQMPELIEEEECQADDGYASIKAEFEKTHAKITDKALIIKIKEDGELVMMTPHKFRDAYLEMKYMDYSLEKPEKKPFVNAWLQDENIRKYEDFGVYPPPLKCPSNIYNLWQPFKVSLYTGDYEKDEEGLKAFLDHISILSNHDKIAEEYLLFWLAQMFQYPAIKTIAITLISEEGAGKGTLLLLLALLIGGNKSRVIEVTKPSRDVWGPFNPTMINAFFVNLNEMCKREAQEAESYIKGLITDGTIIINRKGIDSYTMQSFHRWLITSNDEEPLKVKKGDRRHFVVRCSDEKIGDKQYFENLCNIYENVRTQRTIYDYLMAIPNMNNFGKIPRPETDWLKDNKKLRENHMLLWVEQMVIDNLDVPEKRLSGSEQLELYTKWCKQEGHKYDEPNAISLAVGIKRLNLPGVQSAVRDGNQSKTVYDIFKLKTHFKIGWQG